MNKDLKVPIIIVLVIAIVSLGVAFAAFSSTLNIAGTATVDSATWDIVFEGLDSSSPSTLGAGTPTGTASIVTDPTIKNNSTEISTYEVILNSPGDSVTYNFKIHNRGTIAARVTNVDIKEGIYLTTDTSKRSSEADTLNNIEYKFYYTQGNADVGDDLEKDCLAPDEEELVTLRIVFLASDDESVLPSSNLLLDNLGITVTYTSETSCAADSGGGNSGGGNTPTPSGGMYYAGYEYNSETNEYDEIWVNSLSDVIGNNIVPTTYIKRQNNVISICVTNNSTEYCLSENDVSNADTAVTNICNTIGLNYNDGYGSGSDVGSVCSSSEYTIYSEGGITIYGLHDTYDPNYDYTETEPYYSKRIDTYVTPIGGGNPVEDCTIQRNYSTSTGHYEPYSYSCSYNYGNGD